MALAVTGRGCARAPRHLCLGSLAAAAAAAAATRRAAGRRGSERLASESSIRGWRAAFLARDAAVTIRGPESTERQEDDASVWPRPLISHHNRSKRERLSNCGGNCDVVESKIKRTRLGFFFFFLLLHLNVAASEKNPTNIRDPGAAASPPVYKIL